MQINMSRWEDEFTVPNEVQLARWIKNVNYIFGKAPMEVKKNTVVVYEKYNPEKIITAIKKAGIQLREDQIIKIVQNLGN